MFVFKQLYLEIVIELHTITNYQNGHIVNCKFSTKVILFGLIPMKVIAFFCYVQCAVLLSTYYIYLYE